MNPLDELYQAVILDHSRRPRNSGPQPVPPAFHAEGVNPSCGDEIEVWVTFAGDGKIAKVTFQGQGCAISQSAASIMTVKTSGRTVEEELLSAADQTLRVVDVSAPEELHPIPNQEISAPFDLELEGPWERVVARDGGPPRLEFWFDEDKRFG